MEIALGIVLMVLAVALTACVLLQSGKEKMLSRITTILAVVFCLLVFATVIVITVIVL